MNDLLILLLLVLLFLLRSSYFNLHNTTYVLLGGL
jgi:hypothetical protein